MTKTRKGSCMRKIALILSAIIVILLAGCASALSTSYTYTVRGNTIRLVPSVSQATHYKWIITNGYQGESGWIPISDISNYILCVEPGTYSITIMGLNGSSTTKFTDSIKVQNNSDTFQITESGEETTEETETINFLDNMPEPLQSWLKDRSEWELALMVFVGAFIVLFMLHKSRKIKVTYPADKR